VRLARVKEAEEGYIRRSYRLRLIIHGLGELSEGRSGGRRRISCR